MRQLLVLVAVFFLTTNSFALANLSSDEDWQRKAQLASSAYSCAILNNFVKNKEEHQRLFKIAIDNGVSLARTVKGRMENQGANFFALGMHSDDFVLGFFVGGVFQNISDETYKQIYDGYSPDLSIEKINAYRLINEKNCNILK